MKLALPFILILAAVPGSAWADPDPNSDPGVGAEPRIHGAEFGSEDDHDHPGHAGGTEHGDEHELQSTPIKNWVQLHYSKDEEGGTLEAGEEQLPPPFLAALFNFGLFVFILYRFGGPPIRDFVKNRHETIVTQLDESARLRAEAQKKLDEYTHRLSALDSDIDKMVSEIRSEAEAEKQRMLNEARARAERMQRDADMQIQAELRQARQDLETRTVDAAIAMAKKMLQERLTDTDQVRLADQFVTQVQKQAAQPGGPEVTS